MSKIVYNIILFWIIFRPDQDPKEEPSLELESVSVVKLCLRTLNLKLFLD